MLFLLFLLFLLVAAPSPVQIFRNLGLPNWNPGKQQEKQEKHGFYSVFAFVLEKKQEMHWFYNVFCLS